MTDCNHTGRIMDNDDETVCLDCDTRFASMEHLIARQGKNAGSSKYKLTLHSNYPVDIYPADDEVSIDAGELTVFLTRMDLIALTTLLDRDEE